MFSKRFLYAITFFLNITIIGVIAYLYFINQQSVFAATINAASCELVDVRTAINNASNEDTIIVPVGSCIWDSTLNITKGINLIGAGMASTIINKGLADPLVNYTPSSIYWANNYPFRISGFTFDLGGSGQAITADCGCATTAQTKFRIDHNRFFNSNSSGGVIEQAGCRGVMDNNNFDTFRYPLRVGWGDFCGGQTPPGFGIFTWQYWSDYIYGVAEQTIYVEDNIFTGISATSYGAVTDGDHAGSYVVRYNTINAAESYPLFDLHGGRGNLWGSRGGEVYGNQINNIGSSGGGFLMSQRGGIASVHHNNYMGGGTVNLYNNDGCPPDPFSENQKINNSYHFLNRAGLSGTLLDWSSSGGDNCGGVVVENSTFWMDNLSCIGPSSCSNITAGIVCGTLANRPTSCTAGVGYWATNQSCTDLSGLVGDHPTTPISGTLYKCTASNTWNAYYTPLSYPHPLALAGGGTPDTENPLIPSNPSATAISSSQINLSWTASTDNIGVAGYKIYRCAGSGCAPSVRINTSAINSYSDTSLSANTTYAYAVSAYDAVGNNSGQSAPVSVTTSVAPPLKGDFNSDSKVNSLDFTSLKNAFKSIFNAIFDLNSDSAIDVRDLGILMSGWLP